MCPDADGFDLSIEVAPDFDRESSEHSIFVDCGCLTRTLCDVYLAFHGDLFATAGPPISDDLEARLGPIVLIVRERCTPLLVARLLTEAIGWVAETTLVPTPVGTITRLSVLETWPTAVEITTRRRLVVGRRASDGGRAHPGHVGRTLRLHRGGTSGHPG